MALIKISLSPNVLVTLCLMVAAITNGSAQIEFSNTDLTIEDTKTVLYKKCIAVAGKEKGEEAYQTLESAMMSLSGCIFDITNYAARQEEINATSPREKLNVVFGKYCQKLPDALECIKSFNVKLLPCLDQEEKDNQKVAIRIVRSLMNFLCHKGGDQIIQFIEEKGPECLKSNREAIQQCLINTFPGYVPNEDIENIKPLPKYVLQCDEMKDLEACIISKFRMCEKITPANIVESMFRLLKNEIICDPTTRVNDAMRTTTMIPKELKSVEIAFVILSRR